MDFETEDIKESESKLLPYKMGDTWTSIGASHQSQKTTRLVAFDLISMPVSYENYMKLSDAYDKHSKELMNEKGEEYSVDNDFLAMENRLAGMVGSSPEEVSIIMAGKHITSLGIILEKNDTIDIKLSKWDERIRDAINLLKITSAFVHAKQSDFSLHLGNC